MTATERFLASTRGRILTRLRGDPATVAELAEIFGISTNAARQHVNGLERDGYIERFRIKHTASRPAAVYRPTPDGEALFPKAYGAVLRAFAEQYAEENGAPEAADFVENVGRRLAEIHAPPEEATTEERIDHAVDLLTDLGSVLEVDRLASGTVRLEGRGCPLSGVVRDHTEFCAMIATMLEDMIVLPVEECCRNEGESPSCRFLIRQSA